MATASNYEFDFCPSCGKKVPYDQYDIESVDVANGDVCMSCLAVEHPLVNLQHAYLTAKEERNLRQKGVPPSWYYAGYIEPSEEYL